MNRSLALFIVKLENMFTLHPFVAETGLPGFPYELPYVQIIMESTIKI